MPIGGETIGRAYVRIIGDGSGLPDDVKESFREAEPSVREAGREHGEVYADEFNKQYRKSFKGNFGRTQREISEDINKALTDALAKQKLADNYFKNKDWLNFRKRLVDEYGAAGDLAGKKLEEQFRDSADFDGLERLIANIGPRIRDAQVELLDATEAANRKFREDEDKEWELHIQKLEKEHAELEESIRADIRETDDLVKKTQREQIAGEKAAHEVRMRLARIQRAIERDLNQDRSEAINDLRKSYEKLDEVIRRTEKGEHVASLTRRKTLAQIERMRALLSKLPGRDSDHLTTQLDRLEDRLIKVHPLANRFNNTLDGISHRLGRATGRGSRNDFLHVVGGVTEGVARLLFLGPKLVTLIGTRFTEAFNSANGPISGIVKGIGSIVSLGGLAVAAFAGLAVAASILLVALGPVIALASGLLAIITALASTITFALIGGIVALGGALIPLVAGISAVVIGIATMSDDLKEKLGDQLSGVKDKAEDLSKVLNDELFRDVPKQAEHLTNILSGLRPVTSNLAGAVRDVSSAWLEALDSPGFVEFVDRMEFFLPRSIRRLGKVAENTTGALGGMFEASLPFITEFLNNLIKITDEWEEWANSREGKNDVKDFLDKAADSADSLGNFLGKVVGLFSVLVDQGNASGNNIFDRMAGSIDKFTQSLKDDPDKLRDWFKFGEDLAGEIGDFIENVGALFDELDNEDNRQAALDFIDFLGDIAEALTDLEGKISPILGPLADLFGLLADLYELSQEDIAFDISVGDILNLPLYALTHAIEALRDLDWASIGEGLNTFFSGVFDDIITTFTSIPSAIANIFGRINWGDLIPRINPNRLLDPFRNLGPRIARALGNIDWTFLLRGLGGIPGMILSFFPGLAGRIMNQIGRVPWSDLGRGLAEFIRGIPGRFGGLAQDIIRHIGNVPWSDLGDGLADFIRGIPGRFAGLAGDIVAAIGTIVPNIDIPLIGSGGVTGIAGSISQRLQDRLDQIGQARGNVFNGATLAVIGEAGPEAVVPLNRPLSQVDPSVRWLSAIAQGLTPIDRMAEGGRAGKTIDASGWTIVSPQSDARAVATEALNYLVATSFNT